MDKPGVPPQVSPLAAGLGCRCPRCGQGKLFESFLTVADRCEVCGCDLQEANSGDGPAVFLIFLLGGLVVPLMLLLDAWLGLPLWGHALVGGVFILGGALALLRPLKATVVALHYRNKVSDRDARKGV
ncbi:MAG TPA: DUF983 domain-containing protein [Kiloniellales bacterium]|jgi:uncharacterized protein (DUF983 family)|nr:DUF983 domain-containing protein [Kiloniellales bacterium]